MTLVPGNPLSKLEVKINNVPSPPYFICPRTTFNLFAPLWFGLNVLLLPFCLPYYMSILIDEGASETLAQTSGNSLAVVQRDADGVTVRTTDFGGMSGVNDLNILIETYGPLIRKFEDVGYTRNLNIIGAPYDFRFATSDLARRGFFDDLQNLVENTYETNHQTKISLIAHSHGCNVIWKFLQAMTKEWKDKYLLSFIPISGPFGGFLYSISYFASGHSFLFLELFLRSIPLIGFFSAQISGVIDFFLAPLNRPILRSQGSIYECLIPQEEVFASFGTLVETPSKSYDMGNLQEMLLDLGLADGKRLYDFSQSDELLQIIRESPPMVDTHIIYSVNVPTPNKLIYSQDFAPNTVPNSPTWTSGDGDGLVNLESLSFVEGNWTAIHNASGYETTVARFPDLTHGNAFVSQEAFGEIRRVLNV